VRLRDARPLGLVRVVLWRRGGRKPKRPWPLSTTTAVFTASPDLLFVSPVRPMWDAKHSFDLSRWYWAMREIPQEIEAWCLFSTPTHWLTRAMMQPGARGKTLAQLAEEGRALARTAPRVNKAKLDALKRPADLVSRWSIPLIDVCSETDGGMKVRFQNSSHGPSGRPSLFRELPADLLHDKLKVGADAYLGSF